MIGELKPTLEQSSYAWLQRVISIYGASSPHVSNARQQLFELQQENKVDEQEGVRAVIDFAQYLIDSNVMGCTASARAANNYIEAKYGVSSIKVDVSQQIKDGLKE